MLHTCFNADASLAPFDDELKCFSAEASTLGLKPGQWPDEICLVTGEDQFSGFNFDRKQLHHGELAYVVYSGSAGELHVFND